MIDKALQMIAPHHCYGCGLVGRALCINCKNHIVFDAFELCLACRKPTLALSGICRDCKPSYDRAWCVGLYEGALKETLHAYKFERAKSAYRDFADLLDARVDVLPADVIVTYVPTLSSHRRQRGYDHMKLIAKSFARKRGLKCKSILVRLNKTHQRGSSAKDRWSQSQGAYMAKNVVAGATYLLLDDVVTTGATIEHAARVLKRAGAGQVWVATIARQTLDD